HPRVGGDASPEATPSSDQDAAAGSPSHQTATATSSHQAAATPSPDEAGRQRPVATGRYRLPTTRSPGAAPRTAPGGRRRGAARAPGPMQLGTSYPASHGPPPWRPGRARQSQRKPARGPPPARRFTREAWRLLLPYWRSDERWRAFGLLAAIVVLNLG